MRGSNLLIVKSWPERTWDGHSIVTSKILAVIDGLLSTWPGLKRQQNGVVRVAPITTLNATENTPDPATCRWRRQGALT